MGRKSRFSGEVRMRAVRLVGDHGSEYGSQWEAIRSIAEKIGYSAETLRKWVRRTEIDSGHRVGLTSEEQARIGETSAILPRSSGEGRSVTSPSSVEKRTPEPTIWPLRRACSRSSASRAGTS